MHARSASGRSQGQRRNSQAPPTAKRDPEDGGSREQRPVAVRREVGRQQDDPESPGAEAGEPLDREVGAAISTASPSCAEDASRPGELGGHGLTTTTALETWPLAATTRR